MKKKQCIVSLVLLSLLLVLGESANAWDNRRSEGSLRCSGKLIFLGDRKEEVLRKCGDPVSTNVYEEDRIARDLDNPYLFDYRNRIPLFVRQRVLVEEWTYNFGPTSFIRYLTFENGRLVDIELGDYGY